MRSIVNALLLAAVVAICWASPGFAAGNSVQKYKDEAPRPEVIQLNGKEPNQQELDALAVTTFADTTEHNIQPDGKGGVFYWDNPHVARMWWCEQTLGSATTPAFFKTFLAKKGAELDSLQHVGIKRRGILIAQRCATGFHVVSGEQDTLLNDQLGVLSVKNARMSAGSKYLTYFKASPDVFRSVYRVSDDPSKHAETEAADRSRGIWYLEVEFERVPYPLTSSTTPAQTVNNTYVTQSCGKSPWITGTLGVGWAASNGFGTHYETPLGGAEIVFSGKVVLAGYFGRSGRNPIDDQIQVVHAGWKFNLAGNNSSSAGMSLVLGGIFQDSRSLGQRDYYESRITGVGPLGRPEAFLQFNRKKHEEGPWGRLTLNGYYAPIRFSGDAFDPGFSNNTADPAYAGPSVRHNGWGQAMGLFVGFTYLPSRQ